MKYGHYLFQTERHSNPIQSISLQADLFLTYGQRMNSRILHWYNHGTTPHQTRGKYLNSGFDRSSFLKTDNSNEFSSSCTTRIVPILTTGVSFLRSYKVSNKRPIMGHPRSDLGCPRSVLVGPGQSQDGPGLSQASPSMARLIWVWIGLA